MENPPKDKYSITDTKAEEVRPQAAKVDQTTTLAQRRAFMKLPLEERRRILAEQAEGMLAHYQQDSEWQELQTGDVIEY